MDQTSHIVPPTSHVARLTTSMGIVRFNNLITSQSIIYTYKFHNTIGYNSIPFTLRHIKVLNTNEPMGHYVLDNVAFKEDIPCAQHLIGFA